LLSCLLLPACATSDDGKPINFSLTAKQNYEKGLAELKDENYSEALRYFTYVKQKFPFSKYAALAELAAADTEFERGSYQESIDAYKSFLRLHPKHEKVEEGYVSFRIAEAYVKEMPSDWFLIPPSYEKDQSAVMDALREINTLIERFPDSKYPSGRVSIAARS
jgi:outer membrane protein assembly factor BamD